MLVLQQVKCEMELRVLVFCELSLGKLTFVDRKRCREPRALQWIRRELNLVRWLHANMVDIRAFTSEEELNTDHHHGTITEIERQEHRACTGRRFADQFAAAGLHD